MSIELTDDGTMDTVLRCTECGGEMRYNYDNDIETPVEAEPFGWQARYDAFVEWAIEDAENEHECPARLRCDACEMLSINGLACHESGCPNARKAWDHVLCAWVDAEPSDDEQDVEDWINEGED